MQGMALLAIPGGLAFAIWRSYRAHRRGLQEGGGYAPAGKIRWEPDGSQREISEET